MFGRFGSITLSKNLKNKVVKFSGQMFGANLRFCGGQSFENSGGVLGEKSEVIRAPQNRSRKFAAVRWR